MTNIILTSFTGHEASGGVPRWVRDFMKGFPEAKSYCWQDVVDDIGQNTAVPEWQKAHVLNNWLLSTGRRKKDDIIIGDGWWAGYYYPDHTVSVCHGIWSHLIKEEADAGVPPDMPHHHREQVSYRKNSGTKLVAVSRFIQHQMDIQFGFKAEVINNAIDLEEFKPSEESKEGRDKPLIIHGINDRGNENKGWSHIQHLKGNIDANILSLDQTYREYKMMRKQTPSAIFSKELTKHEVLALADLVVIPSGYEGNSYFLMESLACDVPVVAYNVGLLYEIKKSYTAINNVGEVGIIMDRSKRSKEETLLNAERLIDRLPEKDFTFHPRDLVKSYSIEKFHEQWKTYLKKEFNYGC